VIAIQSKPKLECEGPGLFRSPVYVKLADGIARLLSALGNRCAAEYEGGPVLCVEFRFYPRLAGVALVSGKAAER